MVIPADLHPGTDTGNGKPAKAWLDGIASVEDFGRLEIALASPGSSPGDPLPSLCESDYPASGNSFADVILPQASFRSHPT